MKRFSLPIPSNWRNPKRLPISTHVELVERVAALMERVASQDAWLGHIDRRLVSVETGNRNRFLDPSLGRPWIPRAVVFRPTKEDLVDLERLEAKPGVVQPLQPGEVTAPIPTPVSERPWEGEGWCNALGKCWWQPPASPGRWYLVEPRQWLRAGWLLPHYALPVIPAPEGGQQ